MEVEPRAGCREALSWAEAGAVAESETPPKLPLPPLLLYTLAGTGAARDAAPLLAPPLVPLLIAPLLADPRPIITAVRATSGTFSVSAPIPLLLPFKTYAARWSSLRAVCCSASSCLSGARDEGPVRDAAS